MLFFSALCLLYKYIYDYIHIYTRVCLCVVYMAESGSEVCCVLTPVGHCHGGRRVATPYQAQPVLGALQFLCLLLSYYEYEFFIIWQDIANDFSFCIFKSQLSISLSGIFGSGQNVIHIFKTNVEMKKIFTLVLNAEMNKGVEGVKINPTCIK